MKLSRVGIDLAKNVYQLHGVDRSGKTVWRSPYTDIVVWQLFPDKFNFPAS